jgi:DNA-3-methyladenine glycosylase II
MLVDGPFSLTAAASFGFGPRVDSPDADSQLMRLAFVTDDLRHHAAAVVRQDDDGALEAEMSGTADIASAERQLRRVLSIDRPVGGWIEAGLRDPVLGRLQARHAGLRPVLFHSPYEAAAWAIISQRRHRSQAAALRQRLSEALGRAFRLADQDEYAFPLPEQLLSLASFPGFEPARIARLRGVAERALAGQLDPSRLVSMDADEAIADLQSIPGIGPFYAALIQLRSTGVADTVIDSEPRLAAYLRHYYDLPQVPDGETIRRIAEHWRPFRTWAGVLIRVAGDRDGLATQTAGARAQPGTQGAGGRRRMRRAV